MLNTNTESKKDNKEAVEISIDLTRLCLEEYLSVERVFGKSSENQHTIAARRQKMGIA